MTNQQNAEQLLYTLTHSSYAGLGLGGGRELRGSVVYTDYGCKCQYYLRVYDNTEPSHFITSREALKLVDAC